MLNAVDAHHSYVIDVALHLFETSIWTALFTIGQMLIWSRTQYHGYVSYSVLRFQMTLPVKHNSTWFTGFIFVHWEEVMTNLSSLCYTVTYFLYSFHSRDIWILQQHRDFQKCTKCKQYQCYVIFFLLFFILPRNMLIWGIKKHWQDWSLLRSQISPFI